MDENQALGVAQSEAVAVKALEWAEDDEQNWGSATLLGRYGVYCDTQTYSPVASYYAEGPQGFIAQHPTLEMAKAAAQAHFDQRIRSALTHPAPPLAVTDEDWVLVPKAPTVAMMDAVHSGMAEQRAHGIHIFSADVWDAMITAALEAKAEGQS